MRRTSVATARLSMVEISSALARRCREKAFSAVERDRALAAVAADFEELYIVELTRDITQCSQVLLRHHSLRAGDAVQLASAVVFARELRVEVGFLAFDQRLITAAREEGLRVQLEER